MTIFNCVINIEDKEYNGLLLNFNLIDILQNKILEEFQLPKCNYSLYAIKHHTVSGKKEASEEIIKVHIFNCILHIFD